ncbi:MAG: cation-transporting P-type ATPase, partial [Pseudomonadota bacterium]|nr:cation-transporting P-type ATPase [Pseudomonadota bacterium]
MNEDLAWHFDLAVIEWLIVLVMLVVLGLLGAVVTQRTLKAVKGVARQSRKPPGDSNPWHAMANARVFKVLDAGPDGLAKDEVNLRLGAYGPNRLPEARTRGPLVRFVYQFHNVLIYVLLAASGVTAMLEHWVDAGVILGVVVVNAVIGFVQEGKA